MNKKYVVSSVFFEMLMVCRHIDPQFCWKTLSAGQNFKVFIFLSWTLELKLTSNIDFFVGLRWVFSFFHGKSPLIKTANLRKYLNFCASILWAFAFVASELIVEPSLHKSPCFSGHADGTLGRCDADDRTAWDLRERSFGRFFPCPKRSF